MSTLKNLLTFGAHGRIEEAMKQYNKVKKRYNSKLRKMKSKSREVNSVLDTVVQVKIEAINNLATFKNFSTSNIERSSYKIKLLDFKQVNQTLENGQLALAVATGATVGTTAGVGTALATWGLASTFGVASTGTAISTLSGAAATSATLALLGGGSVAAGGGGMIAGATVLGGIVAIPALVVLGFFSHFSAKKKIADIESAIYKMQINMSKMDTNMIRLKEIQKKSNKLKRLIEKKSKSLRYELNIAKGIVDGEMNRVTISYHQIRTTIFNRNVSKLANEISILIDTPVFNEDTKKPRIRKKTNLKNGLVYILIPIIIVPITAYILALSFTKETISLKDLFKNDLVNNFTTELTHLISMTSEEEKSNHEPSNIYNEQEEEINNNVVTILVTKNYGQTEILNDDYNFNTGETMNDVLYKYKDELELVVRDNRIFSIKGVKLNQNGSERWMSQITDIDGLPVDSIESELKNGDTVELDLQ